MHSTHLPLSQTNARDSVVMSTLLLLLLTKSRAVVLFTIYDKRDDLFCLKYYTNVDNFQFLDGDFHSSHSRDVYILKLIRSARVCSDVNDFHKEA